MKLRKNNFNSGLTSKVSLVIAHRNKILRLNSKRSTSSVTASIVTIETIVTIAHPKTTRTRANARKSTRKKPSARLASNSRPESPPLLAPPSGLRMRLRALTRKENRNQSEQSSIKLRPRAMTTEPARKISTTELTAATSKGIVKNTTTTVASAEAATGTILRRDPTTKSMKPRHLKRCSQVKVSPKHRETLGRAEVENRVVVTKT